MKEIGKKIVASLLIVIIIVCSTPLGGFVNSNVFSKDELFSTIAKATDAFTLYGSAQYLEDGSIQLTPVATNRTGSCYYNDIIDAREGFAMSIDYCAGGGTGADGIAFCFSESKSAGGYGGGLGFIPGEKSYGVELDSFYNTGSTGNDPCRKHVAIIGKDPTNHMAWKEDYRVDDNQWHNLKVIYNANTHSMTVFIDRLQELSSDTVYLPDYCYLGITAATGSSTNRHLISNISIISKYVNVSSNDCGMVNFKVVNAQSLAPISGANIFVSNQSDGDTTFTTDANGNASILLPIGRQTISVYYGKYQTKNININVAPGINNIPTIGLSEYSIVDANITITEMKYDEIIDAGIDVTAQENQQVFKYDVVLTYEAEVDISSIIFYFNSEGKCVGGISSNSGSGSAGFGTFPAYKAGEGYAIKLPDETVVYAASEKMLLVIRGEAKWLKEMFDVEMLIINNSLTDTIENCYATLDLPEGMSLAKMSEEKQSLTQIVSHIDKGACAAVRWYLCGDKEGDYSIGVALSGTTMPFEEELSHYYRADSSIHVYAGNAFAMTFEVPDVTYYNEDALIKITLENVSNRNIYNVTHSIKGLTQSRVTYESDGTVDNETYKNASNIGHVFVSEMKPGDKIVIELSVNILFDSKALKEMLESWSGVVDQIEKFYNLFNMAQKLSDTVYNLLSKTFTTVTSAKSSLDALEKVETFDEAKHEAIKELTSTLTRLISIFSSNDSKQIALANKLVNSNAYSELVKFTDKSNEDMFTPINDWVAAKDYVEIMNVVGYLNAIIKDSMCIYDTDNVGSSAANNGSGGGEGHSFGKPKAYNIFDSIRTAIRALPIYYVFSKDQSYSTTLSGSTTEIPITIKTYDNGKTQYFGVSDMGKYIYSLGTAAIGKVSMPGIFGIIGGYDASDVTGYDDAIKYIKATENEIARVQAISATGDISFRAYVVKKEPVSTYSMKKAHTISYNAGDEYFALSCNNETAQYENGVLTFSGGGIIEITPLTMNGGILYIEDSIGNVFTYDIDVVPVHECNAYDDISIVTPTDENNGYVAKCCSICGDILDIVELEMCKEHNLGSWDVSTNPTCTEEGLDIRECLICGYRETRSTDKLEHNYGDWIITQESTCQTEGSKIKYCANCNNAFTEAIAKKEHTYGDWKITKAATCTQTGTQEKVCSACGDKVIETINTIAHSYSTDWTIDKESTCTEEGSKSHHCTSCGNKSDVTAIAKKEHTYVPSVIKPTCTTDGYTSHTCSVCGTNYTDTVTSKTGHCDNDNNGYCDKCDTYLGTQEPDDPSTNCSCNCHKSGIIKFFWKIINFFHKLFGMKQYQYCNCGNPHW